MKKILLILSFLFIFAFNVSAFNLSNISPTEDFVVFSENSNEVATILGSDIEVLNNEISEKGIKFLAVNKDNTKQIQLICSETEFSNSVSNLTNLSNDSIISLLPQLTGMNNIKGEVVFNDNTKYVKINLRNDNEKYILSQYFTVIDGKNYVLTFYTAFDHSTEYIDKIFKTTNFNEPEINTKKITLTRVFTICGTVIFAAVCVILIFTILKDILPHKKDH